jgi:hypothetical protein
MKINKKEYGMGGSTMEMYASGGMLKALLKDPKQREMAKAMINQFEDGGKVDPEGEVTATAVPTKEDIMDAYKQSFAAGQSGQSLEQFLAQGVDEGDLNKLKSAAVALAEKRQMAERKKSPAAGEAQMKAGRSIGSSYMPGSQRGFEAAEAANTEAVDQNIMEMLKELGLS